MFLLFKVASFEIVDLPLIKYIASKNKPILMSTGMASLEEIGNAIETAKISREITLLPCFIVLVVIQPPISEANLNSILILKKRV